MGTVLCFHRGQTSIFGGQFSIRWGQTSTLGDATIYPNNYKYFNIRSYLNGKQNQFVLDGGTATQPDIDWTGKGFIDIAFTNEAEILIDETKVDNSSDSTFPEE